VTGTARVEPGSTAWPLASDAAILLGGGRASRLGGVDKPAIVVGDRSLADHAFEAVRGCRPVIAVGPSSLARDDVVLVREEPPFGGPVAALAAGIRALASEPEWVFVLACDLPRAASAVAVLREQPPVGPDVDGLVLLDVDGREQWLAGRYRLRALRPALEALGETSGASVRRVATTLNLVGVPDRDGASIDLDTWDDIRRYSDE